MGFLSKLGNFFTGGGVTGLIGSTINAVSQAKTNKENRDYSAHLTQQQWERDDNAHQREVADLQKAGLSPLASTQGAVTSDPVTSMNQAPQVDVNALVNGAIAQADIKQRENELNESARQFNARLGEDVRQFDQKILMQQKELDEQIRNNNLIDSNTKTQLTNENALIQAQIENYSEIKKDNEFYRVDTAQKTLMSVMKEKYGTPNYKLIDNPAEAGELFRQWTVQRDNFISGLLADSESQSDSKSGSGGLSFGSEMIGKVGANGSGSSAQSTSKTQTSKIEQQIFAWYSSHPVPIYKGDYSKLEKSVGLDK